MLLNPPPKSLEGNLKHVNLLLKPSTESFAFHLQPLNLLRYPTQATSKDVHLRHPASIKGSTGENKSEESQSKPQP